MVFGFNIKTNDPKNTNPEVDVNGESKIHGTHNKCLGAWKIGQVLSSPAYFGYRSGGSISRIGVSHPAVQDLFQNGLHESFFKPGNQRFYNQYDNFQGGFWGSHKFDNPYSLY